jgi:hypothetical protein
MASYSIGASGRQDRRARDLPVLLASAVLVAAMMADRCDPALARAFARGATLSARRVGRFNSLTGVWSGEYRYPTPLSGVRGVPFNARIEESEGAFTGDIDEPNTFADPSARRLFATISGTRKGSAVSFIKTMDGTGGANHSIFYEGVVNSDFTRIEGRWSIPGDWGGSFFMERAGAAAEEAAIRAESTANQ